MDCRNFVKIFGNKDVVLVVFEIFLLHKDKSFLPSNYENGISTDLYRLNNVGAINIVFG